MRAQILHPAFRCGQLCPTQPRAFRWGTVTVAEAVAPGLGVRPLVVNLWCLSWHNRESILYRLLLGLFRLLIVITVNWFSIHTCQNSALKNAKFCIKKRGKLCDSILYLQALSTTLNICLSISLFLPSTEFLLHNLKARTALESFLPSTKIYCYHSSCYFLISTLL